MGAFFLTPTHHISADGAVLPSDSDVRGWFTEEGFAAPIVRETGRWRLYVFPSIGSPAVNLYDDEDGGFCAITGTVLYRGTTGETALPLVLRDIKAGGLDAGEIYGQYAIITSIGGVLSLQTDPIGIYPVWHNDEQTACSSSFLAVARATPTLNIDPQCVYEYVFQGTTYGGRTLFREVRVRDCLSLATFGDIVTHEILHQPISEQPDSAPLAEQTDRNLANLDKYYDALVAAFGDRIDTALSGGYDSRLTLALLRARDVTPAVHVYGAPDDGDVVVARDVAAGEGFDIEHVDKSTAPRVAPDAFAQIVHRNMLSFQGHPADGIFDNGDDLRTRLDRCQGGRVALNGGGGEIFRNFFYLPDRRFHVRELLWSFYGAFDPGWCTDAFNERVYLSNMAQKVKRVLGKDGDKLDRVDVEAVYPQFRCRYWMGKNNSVNNRLGPALTPFIDANIVPDALRIPLKYKNSGLFEARLIRTVSPSLARYMSDYGHNFAEDPPPARLFKDLLVRLRPPRLRRLSFRLKNRRAPDKPYWLTAPYLGQVIDPTAPRMSRFFHIERVNHLDQLNRIYTLEYLFDQLQPVAAEPS